MNRIVKLVFDHQDKMLFVFRDDGTIRIRKVSKLWWDKMSYVAVIRVSSRHVISYPSIEHDPVNYYRYAEWWRE